MVNNGTTVKMSRRFRRIYRFICIGALSSYLGFYTIHASSADHINNARHSFSQDHIWEQDKRQSRHGHPHRPTTIYPRGGASLQQYRDVLRISQQSSKLKKRSQLDDEASVIEKWDSSNDQGYVFSRNKSGPGRRERRLTSGSNNGNENSQQPKGNPVVYRYFGRSRARSIRSDSIPFIVIGPSVDHWSLVGRILGLRGFNMIAIERVKKDQKKKSPSDNNNDDDSCYNANGVHEGEGLVSTILDVLKWKRAILVGCDEESVIAIEAALRLAPDRVVGLVLCGDLSSFQAHIEQQIENMKNYSSGDEDDTIDVDSFLQHYVECPTQLIWDGDLTTWSSAKGDYPTSSTNAKVILGGGLAPHRRLPEQFAWTLTRFVEKKVSTGPQPTNDSNESNELEMEDEEIELMESEIDGHRRWNIFPTSQIFTSGSLIVSGRILASTIIYLSIARATVFQYKNVRDIQFSAAFLNLSKWEIVKKLVDRVKSIKYENLLNMVPLSKELLHRIQIIRERMMKDLESQDSAKEEIEGAKEHDVSTPTLDEEDHEGEESFESKGGGDVKKDRKQNDKEKLPKKIFQQIQMRARKKGLKSKKSRTEEIETKDHDLSPPTLDEENHHEEEETLESKGDDDNDEIDKDDHRDEEQTLKLEIQSPLPEEDDQDLNFENDIKDQIENDIAPTPKPNSRPNSQEKDYSDSNPLLHKLLMFDQIIS